VLCVTWSRTHAYQLAGGDVSGQLRLWDIRRAGPLHTFDADQTLASAPPQPATLAQGLDEHAAAARAAQEAAAAPGGSEVLKAVPGHQQAHQGAVTGLLQTPDGLNWVSAGADNAIRLWDAQTWHNCLVRYPEAFNSARSARQIAVDESCQVRSLNSTRQLSVCLCAMQSDTCSSVKNCCASACNKPFGIAMQPSHSAIMPLRQCRSCSIRPALSSQATSCTQAGGHCSCAATWPRSTHAAGASAAAHSSRAPRTGACWRGHRQAAMETSALLVMLLLTKARMLGATRSRRWTL
jgi:WD domain, G-beta repeat